jgi:hypothetical protein
VYRVCNVGAAAFNSVDAMVQDTSDRVQMGAGILEGGKEVSDTPRTIEHAFMANVLPPPYPVVCAEFAQQLERELAEARAEIERLNKNIRLLLCSKHLRKCEGGLFNSKYPADEPCLICELERAEK